jgi:hypothetical protein
MDEISLCHTVHSIVIHKPQNASGGVYRYEPIKTNGDRHSYLAHQPPVPVPITRSRERTRHQTEVLPQSSSLSSSSSVKPSKTLMAVFTEEHSRRTRQRNKSWSCRCYSNSTVSPCSPIVALLRSSSGIVPLVLPLSFLARFFSEYNQEQGGPRCRSSRLPGGWCRCWTGCWWRKWYRQPYPRGAFSSPKPPPRLTITAIYLSLACCDSLLLS